MILVKHNAGPNAWACAPRHACRRSFVFFAGLDGTGHHFWQEAMVQAISLLSPPHIDEAEEGEDTQQQVRAPTHGSACSRNVHV